MGEEMELCPFCGSNEVGLFRPSECRTGANNRDFYIQCFGCNVETAEYLTVDEAIAAWNTRAPADLRSALEAETIERCAQVAEAIGMQAGVGGMETAGAIVSYLANHPDLIKPFIAGEISTLDFSPRWLVEGRLTWLGRDDKIHSAEEVALGDAS